MKPFATHFITRHPWLAVIAFALLTGVALVGALRVTTDPSNERLFLRHHDTYRVYQRFLATFGSDETILVALHRPDASLLEPHGLAAIRALTQELASLPAISSVMSLTTVQDPRRLEVTAFGLAAPRLIESDSLTAEQIESIRTNGSIVGTLISADLQTAGILVTPDHTRTTLAESGAWLVNLRTVAANHAVRGYQTYVAGTPIERRDVDAYLQRDQQVTIPLVFLILFGVTYGLYRQLRLTLIPVGCVVLSLIWTMGLVGFIGQPLNVITSLLPPVLMVVSVSAAIHLLNTFLTVRATGMAQRQAIHHAVRDVGAACGLTALTTMLGFFSLLVSPVPAVREFALLAGLGVGIACAITMTGVPLALLLLAPNPSIATAQAPAHSLIEHLLEHNLYWVLGHRRRIFLGAALIILIALPGLFRLIEGTDIVRALKSNAPLRVSTEFIDHHLTGVNALELSIELPEAGLQPPFIRRILAFSHTLRSQPQVTAVHSPWEGLRWLRPNLLADNQHLQVIATLLPLTLPLDQWLNADAQALRLSIRTQAMSSDRFLALAQHVEHQVQAAGLNAQLTGANYLLARMSRTLVFTQLRSLALAIILILGTIALALRSWRLGILAAIPNLLPSLMVFGLMGWCGIQLSTATTMIASVALGLVVDDTIHLLYRYRQLRQIGQEVQHAIADAVRHTGRALVITTLILTLGFWAGLAGSFKPTVSFSFLIGLTMILALLADLLVLPAVLLLMHRDRNDVTHPNPPGSRSELRS